MDISRPRCLTPTTFAGSVDYSCRFSSCAWFRYRTTPRTFAGTSNPVGQLPGCRWCRGARRLGQCRRRDRGVWSPRPTGPAFESPGSRIPISSLRSLSPAASWFLQGGMGPARFHIHNLGRSILGVGHSSVFLLTLTGLLAGSSLISSPAGVCRQLVRHWKTHDVVAGFRGFRARHTYSVTLRTVKQLPGRVSFPSE